MKGRKYCQLRELSWFEGVPPHLTDGQKKETTRQFLLAQSQKSYLSLSNHYADWHEFLHGNQPDSGSCGESRWLNSGAPIDAFADRGFRLTGWFELTRDSVWNIAHACSDEIEVIPTILPDGFSGAFELFKLPIYDFLDVWILREDFIYFEKLLGRDSSVEEPLNPSVFDEIEDSEVVSAEQDSKAMSSRERNTLYRIIATMLGSNYNPRARSYTEVAQEIVSEGRALGIELNGQTVRKKLSGILEELPLSPLR